MEKQTNYIMTRCEATELLGTLQKKYKVEMTTDTKDLIKFLDSGKQLTIIEE